MRQGTAEGQAMLSQVDAVLDIEELNYESPEGPLTKNQIARVTWKCAKDLAVDPYANNRMTGSFILVDANSGATVAAGMMD